jgi:hypothetical protein
MIGAARVETRRWHRRKSAASRLGAARGLELALGQVGGGGKGQQRVVAQKAGPGWGDLIVIDRRRNTARQLALVTFYILSYLYQKTIPIGLNLCLN